MDLDTIAISVVSSGTVTSILLFVAKRAIDQSLNTHFERIRHENKVLIDERIRRAALTYDDQYSPCKHIHMYCKYEFFEL